jgi:hypothetical protein
MKNFFDQFNHNSICSPMNNLEFDKHNLTWLNPNNQTSFNSGWFEKQDFLDWLEGKGKIVKGNTEEEKLKFWNFAKFVHENENGWSVYFNYKYFDLVLDYDVIAKFGQFNKNSLTIKTKNKEEIIGKILGSFLPNIKNDFKYRKFIDVIKEYRDILYGAKKALYILGCGYFSASNTPCQVKNLNWFSDVVISKAYYQYLLEEGIVMPDFNFVNENRYKFN